MKRRTLLASAAASSFATTIYSGRLLAQGSMPARIFDCHAHFYTDDVANYPYDPHTARYGPERMYAKAITNPMTAAAVMRFWESVNIVKGLGVQYSSTYFTDNSYLLDIADQNPGKIIPIVILDATAAQTPATLARWARERGIAGVRFMGGTNSDGQFPYLTDAALPAWEICNELGLTITLMPLGGAPGAALPRVAELARRYSNVEVVLDHIGFPIYSRSPETFGFTDEHFALAQIDNINYKYTTLLIEMLRSDNAPLREFCEFSVATFGADHMIWGSDIGNSEVNDIEYLYHAVDSAAGLSVADRNALFFDTAERLFIQGGRGSA